MTRHGSDTVEKDFVGIRHEPLIGNAAKKLIERGDKRIGQKPHPLRCYVFPPGTERAGEGITGDEREMSDKLKELSQYLEKECKELPKEKQTHIWMLAHCAVCDAIPSFMGD